MLMLQLGLQLYMRDHNVVPRMVRLRKHLSGHGPASLPRNDAVLHNVCKDTGVYIAVAALMQMSHEDDGQ